MGELVTLAIKETPAVIDLLRQKFMAANPTAPSPTDQEVIDAYQSAFASSLAVDDAWRAAHPETPPPSA